MKLETTVTVTVGEMASMNGVANLLRALGLSIEDEGKGFNVATELWEVQQSILRTIEVIEKITKNGEYKFTLDEFVKAY